MLRPSAILAVALSLACGSSGNAPLSPNTGGPKTFTLTFTSSGDGSLSAAGTACRVAQCTATFASGTAVTIAAAPDNGASFVGFTGDCSGATCSLTMNADHSVGGSFSHVPSPPGKVRLTVHVEGSGSATSTPAGIDCGATCSALFDTGTSVTLRATAAAGSHFVGWGAGCSGPGACAFTIGNDTDVNAKFEADAPAPAKVTVAVTGTGSVRSTPTGIDCPGACQASFAPGTSLTLTATPAAAASFKEWTGACSGSVTSCNLTVNSDVQAGATFVASPPDECTGLRPADPGAAPYKHSTSFEHGGACLSVSDTDGSGTLPLVAQTTYYGHTDFVSATGNLLSTGGGGIQSYVGLLSGFERYNATSSYSWLEAFDTSGHRTAQTPSQNGYRNIRADPIEGIVSSFQDLAANNVRLESYDDHLTLRWTVTLPANLYALRGYGVDRKGQTLVVFAGDSLYGAGSLAAEWIDHAGVVGAPFPWSGPHGVAFEPRVDSGLFFRDKTGLVMQIDSGATTASPAPSWRQTIDPRATLHMVHGGRGYAVLPPPGSSPTCTQVVEVRAPSGASCGSATFAIGTGGACDTKGITVGYDGTVVQQFPDSAEQQRSDGQATCTWQWWPGFFR
jgi:hypothetical protein